MRYRFIHIIIGFCALFSFGFFSNELSAQEIPSDLIHSELLRVGDESFTLGQISHEYSKKSPGKQSFYELSRDSALDFLNLYANFRLKILAAKKEGYDKNPALVNDLQASRDQLAIGLSPSGGISGGYLMERKIVDPAVDEIFKRRDNEIKIALIFISMRENDPSDTLRAYRKARNVLNEVLDGGNFGKIAADSSDDQKTKNAGGEMGWITGGMILRQLEDAAFMTSVGQVYPKVIRVSSGYAILKVLDRDKRVKIRGAHIFTEITKTLGKTDNRDEAKAKAESLLARIKGGESFEDVAKSDSEDRTSGAEGGNLLSFYTRSLGFESRNGKLVPEFENALFSLKDGEMSDVVESSYGFHIIKRLESRIPTFEEESGTIRKLYKQQFFDQDRERYVEDQLYKQGLAIDQQTLTNVLLAVNQERTAADSNWANGITKQIRGSELFAFGGESFSVSDWIDSVETNFRLRALPLRRETIIASIYTLLGTQAIRNAAENLEDEYPDFAELINEYRDGNLIFTYEKDHIYNKIASYDEAKGKEFFQSHRKDYMTTPEIGLTEIYVYTQDEAKKFYKLGMERTVPFDTLASLHTQRQGYRDKAGHLPLADGRRQRLVKEVLDRNNGKLPKVGTIFEPIRNQGGWSIVQVREAVPAREKSYQEARGELMGDYADYMQSQLKEDLVKRLKKEFTVTINKGLLDKAFASR